MDGGELPADTPVGRYYGFPEGGILVALLALPLLALAYKLWLRAAYPHWKPTTQVGGRGRVRRILQALEVEHFPREEELRTWQALPAKLRTEAYPELFWACLTYRFEREIQRMELHGDTWEAIC